MFEPETSITAKSFVLLSPAISPVYHNNPAFRLVSLDTDQLSLVDYTQYYMDLVMATREFWFNKVNKDFSRVEIFLCIRATLHFFHLLEKIGIHVICGIFLKYNSVNWPLLAASNLAIIVKNKLLLWNNERACHTHFTMNNIKQLLAGTEYDMKNYADHGGLIIIICKICYPSEFSNPVWQVDYTFSKKYPSDNTLINAERIYELNEQLINQTSNTFWKGYAFSRETNYQPMPYNRFKLYCGMRFVDFQNFQKCTQKYSVPGGWQCFLS